MAAEKWEPFTTGDRVVAYGVGLVLAVGLAASFMVPGAESFLDMLAYALLVGLGVMAAGWCIMQVLGEMRLNRELRRPVVPLSRGVATCLRRVDPDTGLPYDQVMAARKHAAKKAKATRRFEVPNPLFDDNPRVD